MLPRRRIESTDAIADVCSFRTIMEWHCSLNGCSGTGGMMCLSCKIRLARMNGWTVVCSQNSFCMVCSVVEHNENIRIGTEYAFVAGFWKECVIYFIHISSRKTVFSTIFLWFSAVGLWASSKYLQSNVVKSLWWKGSIKEFHRSFEVSRAHLSEQIREFFRCIWIWDLVIAVL